MGFEVVVGIENDEKADDQYKQRKQQRQAIQTKTKRKPECREPP